AGGIVNLFQGERGDAKHAFGVHHHGAVLAAFDYQRSGAHFKDSSRGAQQVVLVREHARFGVVDHQHVGTTQDMAQVLGGALDPVVHRIEAHHVRLSFDLIEHGTL